MEQRTWVPSPAFFSSVLCTVGMEAAGELQASSGPLLLPVPFLSGVRLQHFTAGNVSSREGDSGEGLRKDMDSEGRGGNSLSASSLSLRPVEWGGAKTWWGATPGWLLSRKSSPFVVQDLFLYTEPAATVCFSFVCYFIMWKGWRVLFLFLFLFLAICRLTIDWFV